MKFLSVIFLLIILVWSWRGYKNTSEVSVAIHHHLQTELRNFITEYVMQNAPQATNVLFHRFWTEPTQTAEVRAIFEYSFDSKNDENENTTTRLRGFAYLSPQGGVDQWSLDRIEVNNQIIDFKNGSVISPQSTESQSDKQ